jgi:hypothetical protein
MTIVQSPHFVNGEDISIVTARSNTSCFKATGIYSLDIAHRLDTEGCHQIQEGDLPELGEMSEGFETLGTDLFESIEKLMI